MWNSYYRLAFAGKLKNDTFTQEVLKNKLKSSGFIMFFFLWFRYFLEFSNEKEPTQRVICVGVPRMYPLRSCVKFNAKEID